VSDSNTEHSTTAATTAASKEEQQQKQLNDFISSGIHDDMSMKSLLGYSFLLPIGETNFNF
jgi:hypothetical protein